MAAAHTLDLAAKLEVSAYLVVVEYAETVNERKWLSNGLEHPVRIEVHVIGVYHRQDDRVSILEGTPEVVAHPQVLQFILPVEEPGIAVIRMRIGFLALQLPPVFQIRIVYLHLCAHLGQLPDDDLGAAVSGIPHIFSIRCSQKDDVR